MVLVGELYGDAPSVEPLGKPTLPRYDASIPEDQRCISEPPTGKLVMIIKSPEALEQFQVGKTFYLDFTPVEEAVNSM